MREDPEINQYLTDPPKDNKRPRQINRDFLLTIACTKRPEWVDEIVEHARNLRMGQIDTSQYEPVELDPEIVKLLLSKPWKKSK